MQNGTLPEIFRRLLWSNDFIQIARALEPSPRGELEITDVNRTCLRLNKMDVVRLGRGYAWFDTDTHESFTEFVRIMEKPQPKLGCPEAIGEERVLEIAAEMGKTDYAEYLRALVEPDGV